MTRFCSVEGCKNALSKAQERGMFAGMCKKHREEEAHRRLVRLGKVPDTRLLPGSFEGGKRR